MIHMLSAMIQARQRGMIGLPSGNFGQQGPKQDGPPQTARDVLGATPAVRKAEQTADRHRAKAQ